MLVYFLVTEFYSNFYDKISTHDEFPDINIIIISIGRSYKAITHNYKFACYMNQRVCYTQLCSNIYIYIYIV